MDPLESPLWDESPLAKVPVTCLKYCPDIVLVLEQLLVTDFLLREADDPLSETGRKLSEEATVLKEQAEERREHFEKVLDILQSFGVLAFEQAEAAQQAYDTMDSVYDKAGLATEYERLRAAWVLENADELEQKLRQRYDGEELTGHLARLEQGKAMAEESLEDSDPGLVQQIEIMSHGELPGDTWTMQGQLKGLARRKQWLLSDLVQRVDCAGPTKVPQFCDAEYICSTAVTIRPVDEE